MSEVFIWKQQRTNLKTLQDRFSWKIEGKIFIISSRTIKYPNEIHDSKKKSNIYIWWIRLRFNDNLQRQIKHWYFIHINWSAFPYIYFPALIYLFIFNHQVTRTLKHFDRINFRKRVKLLWKANILHTYTCRKIWLNNKKRHRAHTFVARSETRTWSGLNKHKLKWECCSNINKIIIIIMNVFANAFLNTNNTIFMLSKGRNSS